MTREDAIYEIRQLAVLSTNKNIERITEALNMAIEALTMQYGEWVNSVGKPIKDNHSVYCSICGEWSEYRSDFCPNCGAEMTDRKTENSSEKPNNCECEPRKEQNFCGKCRYLYRDFKYGLSCYRLMDNEPCKYEERKDEPTISKMEQVDEPQTFDKPPKCLGCLYSDLDKAFHPCASCVDFGKYVGEVSGKTEPSFTATDFGKGTITKYTDEPQTDCAWK